MDEPKETLVSEAQLFKELMQKMNTTERELNDLESHFFLTRLWKSRKLRKQYSSTAKYIEGCLVSFLKTHIVPTLTEGNNYKIVNFGPYGRRGIGVTLQGDKNKFEVNLVPHDNGDIYSSILQYSEKEASLVRTGAYKPTSSGFEFRQF